MTKRYCIFITALFCAFLGLFLAANTLSPDRDFSQLENRALQQLPAPSVKTLVSGVKGLLRGNKVTVIEGKASFVDIHTLFAHNVF